MTDLKVGEFKIIGEAESFTFAPSAPGSFYVFFEGGARLTLNQDGSATFEGDADDAARQFFDNLINRHNHQHQAQEKRIAKLEATCGALAAENSELKNFIDSDCWVYDEKQQRYRDAADRKPEIPTTKFFIGETLAQGVDEAISHIPNILPPTQDAQAITGALQYLAHTIRQEAK